MDFTKLQIRVERALSAGRIETTKTGLARTVDMSEQVRKVFGQRLKKAGLSSFRVYDLRHTFASSLLAQGAPITFVSAQLGHSRPTTTLLTPKANRALPVLQKCPIQLVGRGGLEPPTR